jgi:hypothetical protein
MESPERGVTGLHPRGFLSSSQARGSGKGNGLPAFSPRKLCCAIRKLRALLFEVQGRVGCSLSLSRTRSDFRDQHLRGSHEAREAQRTRVGAWGSWMDPMHQFETHDMFL